MVYFPGRPWHYWLFTGSLLRFSKRNTLKSRGRCWSRFLQRTEAAGGADPESFSVSDLLAAETVNLQWRGQQIWDVWARARTRQTRPPSSVRPSRSSNVKPAWKCAVWHQSVVAGRRIVACPTLHRQHPRPAMKLLHLDDEKIESLNQVGASLALIAFRFVTIPWLDCIHFRSSRGVRGIVY